MPSQTFTHSSVSPASQPEAWRALQLPGTWDAIPGVERVYEPVFEAGDLIGFSFEIVAAGMRYPGKATPNGRTEGESMGWDITTSELKGSVVVTLGPAAEGTMVTVTLALESAGTLSSMFFPFIVSSLGAGFPKAVDEFASNLN